jgi:hypothetical protein
MGRTVRGSPPIRITMRAAKFRQALKCEENLVNEVWSTCATMTSN